MQNIRVKVYAWVVDCGCENIKPQSSYPIEEVDSKRSFEDGGVWAVITCILFIYSSVLQLCCKPVPLRMRSTWNVFSADNVHSAAKRGISNFRRFLCFGGAIPAGSTRPASFRCKENECLQLNCFL